MGTRELLAGKLVDPEREPLGQAPVVDEDDGRAVLLDEVEDRVDRRPDRAARPFHSHAQLDAIGQHRHREPRGRRQLAHVLHRNHDLQVELFANTRVDEPDLALRPRYEAADLLHRALRRRERDSGNPDSTSRSSRSRDSAR